MHDVTLGKLWINYFLVAKNGRQFFRKFVIRFVLNRGGEFEHCVLFILHILRPEVQFTEERFSFEIYSDKVPLEPWNDILKLFRTSKMLHK